MKPKKLLTSILFIAAMAVLLSNLFALPPVPTFVGLVCFSVFVPMPKGVALMAIQREIWTKDIVDNLFKNNEFAQMAFNADQYVLAGKVVHIPQAGAPSAINKNVTSFPVNALKRTDSEILYNLDTFYSTPRHIERIEQYELEYDKRQSAMGEDQAALIQAAMDNLLYRWAFKPSNNAVGTTPVNVVVTTGAATSVDLVGGATGERKTFTKDVVGRIKKAMDVANIPAQGRVALLTAYHHQQFIDSLSDSALTNFYRVADATKGIIGEYLGFKFYMRSEVLRFRKVSSVWTPIDEQDAGFAASTKTGDSGASLFYQKDCVERAKGQVDIFDNPNRAEYYGDIYSMELRLGGRQRRAEGVYAVVEDIV
jgi:hypothetical protein